MRGPLLLLIVLALALGGLVLVGALEDDTRAPSEGPSSRSGADAAADPSRPAGPDARPRPHADAQRAEARDPRPLVPRVLPPDAALEDVRDALAAGDPDALRAAYERITRMCRKSASFASALGRLAEGEGDPRVRRVVARARETSWTALSKSEREALTARPGISGR